VSMEETLNIFKSLESNEGIPEDIWIAIASMLSEDDQAIRAVSSHHGRYFLPEAQRKRLGHILPFMAGVDRKQLLLTGRSTFDEDVPQRCGCCKGPYHPATGHVFIVDSRTMGFACGICAGRFFARQLRSMGWRPFSKKKQKRLNKKANRRLELERKSNARIAAKLVAKINNLTTVKPNELMERD
jgi:hypothetical protein